MVCFSVIINGLVSFFVTDSWEILCTDIGSFDFSYVNTLCRLHCIKLIVVCYTSHSVLDEALYSFCDSIFPDFELVCSSICISCSCFMSIQMQIICNCIFMFDSAQWVPKLKTQMKSQFGISVSKLVKILPHCKSCEWDLFSVLEEITESVLFADNYQREVVQ